VSRRYLGTIMVLKVRKTISDHRKRLLPGLVALSLLAGVVVSIVATPNAQADYNTGCGYGYSSTGTGFGYGTGAPTPTATRTEASATATVTRSARFPSPHRACQAAS